MKKYIGYILLIVFFVSFFCAFFRFATHSDIYLHASIAISKMQNGQMFSGNFLSFFLMNVFSVFSTTYMYVTVACCFLLALSVVAKYWIVLHFFFNKMNNKDAGIVSFSLLFVYILPFYLPIECFQGNYPLRFYINYFVPNVWHNSTIILCMPFAILTYYYSIQLLKEYSTDNCLKASIANVICVMIKPSFFFAFSCPFVLLSLYKYIGEKKKLIITLMPVFLGVVCVAYQYITIYDGSDGSSVIISVNRLFCLDFWKDRWPYFASSLILPVVFLILNFQKYKNDIEFILVYFMLLVSILIWLLFEELGPRANHGNFYWQIVPSMWFVYLYIVRCEISFLADISLKSMKLLSIKHQVVVDLYLLMVISGFVYFTYFLSTGLYH